MALSDAQKTSLYLCLGIPQADTIKVYGESGTMIPAYIATEIAIITTDITTRLAAITAAEETRLITMITAYDTLQTAGTGEIRSGNIGQIGQITADPKDARKFLRKQICTILGIHISTDWIDRISGEDSGGIGSTYLYR